MALIKKGHNIPNFITCFRFFLIIPIFIFLMRRQYELAFYFFVIAGLSDGLDGYLARRFHWTSRFGAVADPLADKLLMLISYFCLAVLGHIPYWLFAIVVFRDVWLVVGVVMYRCLIAELEFVPSRISKINTVCQLLLVVVLLSDLSYLSLPDVFIEALMYVVLVTAVSSFIDYTWFWGRKAMTSLR